MRFCVDCNTEYPAYRVKCPECGCKDWTEKGNEETEEK